MNDLKEAVRHSPIALIAKAGMDVADGLGDIASRLRIALTVLDNEHEPDKTKARYWIVEALKTCQQLTTSEQ